MKRRPQSLDQERINVVHASPGQLLFKPGRQHIKCACMHALMRGPCIRQDVCKCQRNTYHSSQMYRLRAFAGRWRAEAGNLSWRPAQLPRGSGDALSAASRPEVEDCRDSELMAELYVAADELSDAAPPVREAPAWRPRLAAELHSICDGQVNAQVSASTDRDVASALHEPARAEPSVRSQGTA